MLSFPEFCSPTSEFFCSSDLCYSFISFISFKCLSVSFEMEGYSFDLFVGIFFFPGRLIILVFILMFFLIIICVGFDLNTFRMLLYI